MFTVFLRDLVGFRRLLSSALVIAVAVVVAGAVDLVIAPRVYLVAVVVSAATTTALVLNAYYRVDRLREYAQLPGSAARFMVHLALAMWLVVLLENVSAAIAFGVARGDLEGAGGALMVGYALVATGGVLLSVTGRRSLAGLAGVTVVVGSAVATVTLGTPVVLGLVCGAALGVLGLGLGSRTRYALLADRVSRAGGGIATNYFLTVVGRERVVLVNGLGLTAFAVVFTVAAWDQGLTIPAAFALVGVNSPLATIISGDPDLRLQVTMLGRPRRLLIQYALTVAVYFGVVNGLLVACYLWLGATNVVGLVGLAVVSTLIEAVAVPGLEARFPITKARTQRDVWRHPRKYLVPALLLALAAMVPA